MAPRRTGRQLYGDLPLVGFFEMLYNLTSGVDADVLVVHGGLGLEKDRAGTGRNYEIMDVVVGGRMVSRLKHLPNCNLTNIFLASPDLLPARQVHRVGQMLK
jgi:hypothetical protein